MQFFIILLKVEMEELAGGGGGGGEYGGLWKGLRWRSWVVKRGEGG